MSALTTTIPLRRNIICTFAYTHPKEKGRLATAFLSGLYMQCFVACRYTEYPGSIYFQEIVVSFIPHAFQSRSCPPSIFLLWTSAKKRPQAAIPGRSKLRDHQTVTLNGAIRAEALPQLRP